MIIGKAVILRKGNLALPIAALYTRCYDEDYCRAELLSMMSKVRATKGVSSDKPVIGLYDLDPTYTVGEFRKSYDGRRHEFWSLNDVIKKWKDGSLIWDYPTIVLPDVVGCARPAYGMLLTKISPSVLELFKHTGDDTKHKRNN